MKDPIATPSSDHLVGGLRCSEVLARLSDYVDGELPPEERVMVEAHLRGCDACTRFGGEFAATLKALRLHLLRTATIPPATLRARLRAAIERG